MKKKSKLMIAVLCLVVLAMMFASCTKNTSDESVASETDNAPAKVEDSKESEDAMAEKEPLELSALLIQYSQPPDPESELWKTIEDTLNVKYEIDWVPSDGYMDKVNLSISSGDLKDITFVTTITDPTILKAIKGGMFADLTPILGDFSEWPNLGATNPDAWITSKVDGKNHLFPRSRGNYDMPLAQLRGDWLDALGMEVPTTVDEFADYLRGVVNGNLDGDDTQSTIGVTNLFMEWMPSAYGDGAKTPARPEGESTGIVNVRLTESYALALEYWQGLYAEGLVSKEYALLGGTEQEELFISGKSAAFTKNIWHRKRMDNELQTKVDPEAYAALMFSLEGPGGKAFCYDKGYAGGLLVSSEVSDEKLRDIVAFMDSTADIEKYNLLCFGIEGVHYTMVDGFPTLTEQGKKEIGNAIQYPFCLASNTFAKVDSPLADAAYNLETRKMTTDALDPIFAEYSNPLNLDILQSESWATFWSQKKDEFEAYQADVVTGVLSIDEFKEYQQELLQDPLVIASFSEFQESFDGFGLK